MHPLTMNFSGKLALVTAGSKGIGLAICKHLHDMGAMVALCSRDNKNILNAKHKISSDKTRLFAMEGDIGDKDFLEQFVRSSTEYFNADVDILINNNGGPPTGDAIELSEEQWDFAIQRNFLSVVRLCKLVTPNMKKKQWGRIINMTSLSAKEPDPTMALSSCTRAAVAAFSKTLSREVGQYGITVNTILTGGVLTDRAMSFIEEDAAKSNRAVDEVIKEIGQTIPVGHIATPEEFAAAVIFFASEASKYVTGTAVSIDGGSAHGIM